MGNTPETQPAKPKATQLDTGRRKFLGMIVPAAATAVVAVGGKVGYDRYQDTANYLSVNEAAALYNSLKKTVTEKWEQAQCEHKPLRIFMLEGHDSANALAYKLMLADIARKLGIKNLLPEIIGDKGIADTLASNVEGIKAEPSNTPLKQSRINNVQFLQFARKKNYTMEAMDTYFSTPEAFHQFFCGLGETYAKKMLKEHFKLDNIAVKFFAPHYPGDPHAHFAIAGIYQKQPTAQQQAQINEITQAAYDKAETFITDKRNEVMLQKIQDTGSAFITTGQAHGVDLITPLRAKGQIDVAFCVSDKPIDETVKGTARKRIEWARDPANAIQHTGKNFNPQSLTTFIDQVIERANRHTLAAR